MTRRFLLLALALPALASLQAADKPQLTALQTRLTPDGTVFSGDAKLVQGDFVLTAETITYNPKTEIAVATGEVVLTHTSRRLLADEISFNVADQSYEVSRFLLGQPPFFAEGTAVTGNPDGLSLQGARIFYDEPGRLTPSLNVAEAQVVTGDSVTIGGGTLQVGTVPVFATPGFKRSLDNPLAPEITARVGSDSNLGVFVEAGLLSPFSERFSAGGNLGLYSDRGVMFGPAAKYDTFNGADTGLAGSFTTGYIKDQDPFGADILAAPLPSDRGFVEWQHRQTLSPGLTLNGELNYWSDSEIVRDFRTDDFRRVQTPDTWFETTLARDNHVVSAFLRAQPNDYHRMQERLPEVRFDGLPIQIGAGIYHRLNASAAVLREEDPIGVVATTRSERVDAYYSLTRPYSPREWLTMTPVLGGRATHYNRAVGRDHYTRLLGEAGFDVELRASGLYDVQSETWGINGLRHLVTPKISYRYIPEADNGRAFIPAIDRRIFDTYLQPLGLGNRRNIDDLAATNTLRLGVDNVLQTRAKHYGSRDLVALALATDVYFDFKPGTEKTSPLHAALVITPAEWLSFDLYQRYTVQTGVLEEINTGLTLRDADVWSLRLSTHFLENATPIEEYIADYQHRLNEIYAFYASVRYDAIRGSFIEQSFAIRQRLDRLWTIGYVVSFSEGATRESELAFSVRVETDSF
ncbi:MAG: LPS assembly protein LptD [Verrucomicrobiota bacterium]